MVGAPAEIAAGLLLLAAVPATLASLYLALLACAAVGRPAAAAASSSTPTLAILVPAHDEALLIQRCVRSLLAQVWPKESRRVIVIADNCGDSTAALAAEAGAEVWIRSDPSAPGKGQALRWALDRLLAERSGPDAIGVVDADSVAEPNLLNQLVAGLESSPVAQAEYLVLNDGSHRTRLVGLGFLLFHRVRLGGRLRLGLPSALVGNGMLFARSVLEEHPWNAFSGVEDLEYTLRLRLAGIRPRYAPGARLYGPMASTRMATVRQRERWEGGRLHAMRVWLPVLCGQLARGRLDLLDATVDLAVPPLSILGAMIVAGALVTLSLVVAAGVPAWAMLGWVAAAAALVCFVTVGLVAASAGVEDWLSLLSAPGFLLLKFAAYRRVLRRFDAGLWERTVRPGAETRAPEVGGVRIDPLTIDEVRSRLRAALGSRQIHQVATVNMDFLARAQASEEVRAALNATQINVPDGAPVVWLGRLVGIRIPERVAGADLVPLLLEDAGRVGAGVFLLGGEGGVAAEAARLLQARLPGLRVAGVLEPPRTALDEMDTEGILAAIVASDADMLLVALGHPKQDLWIARNRERLPVSVAIGVGCVFDLIAGRVERAPSWMQSAGLEWLFRLGNEPGRLARRYLTDMRWLVVIATRCVFERAGLVASRPVWSQHG